MWFRLGKKIIKFYADPTRHPDFAEIQAVWYAKLEKSEFQDQEDHRYPDRPLKKWSGLHVAAEIIDQFVFQPEQTPLMSTFPEATYREEDDFEHHPEFHKVCQSLCGHGNTKLNVKRIKLIWGDYIQGRTLREIEKQRGISDNRILVLINKITEFMNLMDTRPDNPGLGEEVSKIIIRPYNPDTDSGILYSTWRNAIWYDEKRDEQEAGAFYTLASQQIKKLLSRPEVTVKIACAQDEPDFIAGYSVMSGNHIEWVYVKINFRKKGIAELLTRGFSSVSQPSTKIGKAIAADHNLIIKENRNGTNPRKEETRAEGEAGSF
jgi:hypothetical protein